MSFGHGATRCRRGASACAARARQFIHSSDHLERSRARTRRPAGGRESRVNGTQPRSTSSDATIDQHERRQHFVARPARHACGCPAGTDAADRSARSASPAGIAAGPRGFASRAATALGGLARTLPLRFAQLRRAPTASAPGPRTPTTQPARARWPPGECKVRGRCAIRIHCADAWNLDPHSRRRRAHRHRREPRLGAVSSDRGGGDSKKMVRALTVRIGLSVALFMLLMVAWYFGLISPPDVAASAAATRLDPVDEDEQAEPDHVDEVPVPGDRFEGEVALAA